MSEKHYELLRRLALIHVGPDGEALLTLANELETATTFVGSGRFDFPTDDPAYLRAWLAYQAGQICGLEEGSRRLETITKQLLDHCPDPECMECSKIVCPFGEPLHFHHDGCPQCDAA